jgi:hypothetical protein
MTANLILWLVIFGALLIFLVFVIVGAVTLMSLVWDFFNLITGKNVDRMNKRKLPAYDIENAGVLDLLEEGHDDEAVDLYRRFAGVDEYTARAAVDRMKRGE